MTKSRLVVASSVAYRPALSNREFANLNRHFAPTDRRLAPALHFGGEARSAIAAAGSTDMIVRTDGTSSCQVRNHSGRSEVRAGLGRFEDGNWHTTEYGGEVVRG